MSPRKKSGQPKPTLPKPVHAALVFGDKEIPEGSGLHTAFTRLSTLGERELAGTLALLESFLAAGQSAKKLGQMQAQLDRIEGRILELLRGTGTKTPEVQNLPMPAPGKPAKKPSHAARASVAKELAELEETVEERQARMAKMERDETRKKHAQLKLQEKLKAKQEQESPSGPETADKQAEQEKPAQKKKPRRRRKPAKKENAAQPIETAQAE